MSSPKSKFLENKETEDLPFWVALNSVLMGPKTFQKLFQYFKSAQKIWEASENDLIKAGLLGKSLTIFIQKRKKIDPEKELLKIKKSKIKILTLENKNYPILLKEISNPPYILFYQGNFLESDSLAMAVVGTRRMTPYGKRVCENIVYGLGKNKLTIVSGLALGIDTIAHKTALESKTRTIAVLGTGLDFIYPPTNFKLAQKIIENGAVVSEFPLGMRGFRGNFPQRNRIISGLSLGTFVIEAAARSGALITANFALEQNREVFTSPGSIFSPQSEGCNNLIKMGAKVVTNFEDILDELNFKNKWKEEKKELRFETETEKKIWSILDFEKPIHIDKIIEKTKMSVSEISSILTLMEMKGLVKNLGAQQYVKKS